MPPSTLRSLSHRRQGESSQSAYFDRNLSNERCVVCFPLFNSTAKRNTACVRRPSASGRRRSPSACPRSGRCRRREADCGCPMIKPLPFKKLFIDFPLHFHLFYPFCLIFIAFTSFAVCRRSCKYYPYVRPPQSSSVSSPLCAHLCGENHKDGAIVDSITGCR